MFFNSGAGAASFGLGVSAHLRAVLLAGTILGAGALMLLPGAARAQNYVYTGPAATGSPETSRIIATTTGTDTISITTTAGGTITSYLSSSSNTSGIVTASTVDGDINLNFGATVSNVAGAGQGNASGYIVSAISSGAGSITLSGAGDLTGLPVALGTGARPLYLKTATGAINLGGTGNITIGSRSLDALISSASATSDIMINRSGAFTGVVIRATNAGLGKITVTGIGEMTGSTSGAGSSAALLQTSAQSGATVINLIANVKETGTGSDQRGLSATSTTGAITITTAAGVEVSTLNGSYGMVVTSAGGAIDIGGAAGLGGAVSGRNGIAASNTGAGTINVKTASGGAITASNGNGIQTTAVDGATTIAIGAGSTVTGTTNAIQATTTNGNVSINNAGTVNGSLNAVLSTGGTGTFTFNNTGTLALVDSQSNTGFALNNLSGGVLTGTGSFGAVSAASGSSIRAGDRTAPAVSGVPSMGVMTMSSLTMAAGSKLDVRADFSGVNDKLNVTGAATINGATLRVLATPQTNAVWGETKKSFTVLSAGTLTGSFSATETDYAYLKVIATTSGNDVIATLERGWNSFGSYASTANQKAVSDIFDQFQAKADNPLISKVTTLTVTQAPVALSQLSGTGIATARTQSFAAAGLFNGAVNSEMGKFTGSAGGGSSLLSYAENKKIKTKAFDKVAPKPEPILDGRVWMQALGGVGNLKADGANPSERSTNFGLATGADTALSPNLRAGFALSGGQSTSKVASLATKADATWGQAALYAVATDGERYAKAALVYGYLSTETERKVTAFSVPETAKGKFGANLFSTRLEVGQKFATGGPANMTPFFAFEPSWLVQDAYSETGASTVALGYGKTTTRALPATLGVKIDADFSLDGMRVTPSATLGWVHNFADAASISPFFTALPGSTFTVAGAKGDRNLARTEFNIEATPDGSTATFYANARADLGARTNAVRGTAGVMMRF